MPAIGGGGQVEALSRCRYIKLLTLLQNISAKFIRQMVLQQYACLHPSHSITLLSISAQLWRDAVSGRVCQVVDLSCSAIASVALA